MQWLIFSWQKLLYFSSKNWRIYLSYLDKLNVPRIQLQHITITCVHVIIDVFLGRHYHHKDLPSFYLKSQSRHHVWDPTPHSTPRVRIRTHTKPPHAIKANFLCVHSISRTKIWEASDQSSALCWVCFSVPPPSSIGGPSPPGIYRITFSLFSKFLS